MAKESVANNPIGSYDVKTLTDKTGGDVQVMAIQGLNPPDYDRVEASTVGLVTTFTYTLGGVVQGSIQLTVDTGGNFVSAQRV